VKYNKAIDHMGTLELNARRIRTKNYVQQTVLACVGVAGILAVALIAPNVFQALPHLTGNKYKFGYRARTAAGRLAQKGYVRFVERRGMKYVEITDQGRRVLELEQQKKSLIGRIRKRWDGRWRMIIFDIPEKRSNIRKRLRSMMQELGFLRLQDSVWVFPYDCEEVVALVKAELQVGKDVLYVIAEQIENDKPIKRHFNLK